MKKTCTQGLCLDPITREEAQRRMLTIRGHMEGVLRMLGDESIYCVDALKQIKAIHGALNRVSDLILQSHIKDHVVTASERGDAGKIISELMEVLKYR